MAWQRCCDRMPTIKGNHAVALRARRPCAGTTPGTCRPDQAGCRGSLDGSGITQGFDTRSAIVGRGGNFLELRDTKENIPVVQPLIDLQHRRGSPASAGRPRPDGRDILLLRQRARFGHGAPHTVIRSTMLRPNVDRRSCPRPADPPLCRCRRDTIVSTTGNSDCRPE